MNKIKVIDLLNMISRGEEVPKKIKYENDIYILTDNYCYYCDETNLILSDRLYAEQSRLNDEVEIVEESKIPENQNIKLYFENEVVIFGHLDGLYSYCWLEEDKNKIVHIKATTEFKRYKNGYKYIENKGE